MQAILTQETLQMQQVAKELYTLLKEIDTRWRDDLEAAFRQRLEALQKQIDRLLEAKQEAKDELELLVQRLRTIRDLVAEKMPSLNLPTQQIRDEWGRYRKQLQEAYESLSGAFSKMDVHLPSLRPTNYVRSLFHVTMASSVIVLIQYLVNTKTLMLAVSGTFVVWAWTMEALRPSRPHLNAALMKVFGKMAHPHEWHRINSATWYSTALFLLALFFPVHICLVAIAILGFGDPAAAFIGRRWGRIKLLNGRSLEGTLAFVVAGILASALVLAIWYPPVSWLQALLWIGIASVFGAVAELVSRRIDDNLSIPVAAAVGASLGLLLLGM